MAGNSNSGRFPRGSVSPKPGKMAKICGKQGWRVIGATLALADRDIENQTFIPSKAVIETAWNAIWQLEGKPTVKLDANVEGHMLHGPDEFMQMLQKAQARVLDTPYCLIESQNQPMCDISQPSAHTSALAPGLEEGCRVADPLRYVSQPSELLSKNETQLYINGEGI